MPSGLGDGIRFRSTMPDEHRRHPHQLRRHGGRTGPARLGRPKPNKVPSATASLSCRLTTACVPPPPRRSCWRLPSRASWLVTRWRRTRTRSSGRPFLGHDSALAGGRWILNWHLAHCADHLGGPGCIDLTDPVHATLATLLRGTPPRGRFGLPGHVRQLARFRPASHSRLMAADDTPPSIGETGPPGLEPSPRPRPRLVPARHQRPPLPGAGTRIARHAPDRRSDP